MIPVRFVFGTLFGSSVSGACDQTGLVTHLKLRPCSSSQGKECPAEGRPGRVKVACPGFEPAVGRFEVVEFLCFCFTVLMLFLGHFPVLLYFVDG